MPPVVCLNGSSFGAHEGAPYLSAVALAEAYVARPHWANLSGVTV